MALIVVEIFKSVYQRPRGRSFRYGAISDREKTRLLPGNGDEPDSTSEGARLLPAGEPEQAERTEPSSRRGTDPPDGNPWEGE